MSQVGGGRIVQGDWERFLAAVRAEFQERLATKVSLRLCSNGYGKRVGEFQLVMWQRLFWFVSVPVDRTICEIRIDGQYVRASMYMRQHEDHVRGILRSELPSLGLDPDAFYLA